MPEFRYSVIDSKGQTLNGVIEAENQEVCRKIIAQRGLFCLELAPVSLASRSLNFGGKTKFKNKDLAIFCRQFSSMLMSGIGVIKCLDILHSQNDKAKLKPIIKKVYESVQRGQALSVSMKEQEAFPDLLISMIEAGEASGTLDRVLEKAADIFEKNIKTANKVKGAMMYPMILGIITILVVVVMMVGVLPVFTKLFASKSDLPIPTKILMDVSDSMVNNWYIYIIVILAVSIIWINYLKSKKGRLSWDKFKTKMPVAGKLNVVVISARFARTLSTLIQSGIPLIKALDITSKVLSNKYFENRMTEVIEDIRKGTPLSMAMKKVNVFPLMLLSMLTIGEESGTLEDVLKKTANFYDEESDNAISKLVGLLEPVMIVIMALIIGFIVIAIIMAMYGSMGI